jgi:lipopolysaccharide biosynthesis glycosyltransferase
MAHLPVATYLRLLLPELLPANLDRVVYVDCDVLIRTSLAALYEIPLGEKLLLAVPDMLFDDLPHRLRVGPAASATSGIRYVNAGLLVFDPRRWRAERVVDRVLAFLRMHPDRLEWADQDGINAVLWSEIGLLNSAWNVQYGLSVLQRSARRVSLFDLGQIPSSHACHILHFTGSSKPWIIGALDAERLTYAVALFRSRWMPCYSIAWLIIRSLIEHLRTWRRGRFGPIRHSKSATVAG